MPLIKKGKGKKVDTQRLEREVKKKGIIPQTGFRKGMGTVDNIYVLNYLVSRI